MNLFQNWKNLIEKIENMSSKDVNAWLSLFIIMIAADLFGVYWYLQMKQIGSAILIVLIFFLAILLFFSKEKLKSKETKGGENKMPEEPTEEETPEEKVEPTEDLFDMSGVGLPSSEETQKRLDNALGKIDF